MAYHHGDLKHALVEAAARLLERHGPERLSLRQVALAARVSPAAPYHHFADKSALLAEVAVQGFRGLDAAMARAAGRAHGARKKLAALGLGYLAFALARRAQFRLMFGPELGDKSAHAGLAPIAMKSFLRLVEGVRAAAPGRDPIPGAVLGWSAMHGLATLWLDGSAQQVLRRKVPVARLGARLAAMCVIATAPGRARSPRRRTRSTRAARRARSARRRRRPSAPRAW
jgi:AcrR family transcriptional regulator